VDNFLSPTQADFDTRKTITTENISFLTFVVGNGEMPWRT
jgi:hypothetical protein